MTKNIKSTLLASLIVVILFAGACLFAYRSAKDNNNSEINGVTATANSKSTLDDVTQNTESKKTQELTQNHTSKTKTNDTDQATQSKSQLKPVISSWGRTSDNTYEISAFIQGVIESNGICKLTLSINNLTVVKTREALAGAQTTTCGTFTLQASELTETGVWSAVVNYESAEHIGVSAAIDLEVSL